MRGATVVSSIVDQVYVQFQSTRPVRGATGPEQAPGFENCISIHAPRAGRDNDWPCFARSKSYFNPRAPCGARLVLDLELFLILINFNPRAPCGARLALHDGKAYPWEISIHAPRAGRDKRLQERIDEVEKFQSTRPVRGATAIDVRDLQDIRISIHAPRAGRDTASPSPSTSPSHFNPRAPCGARPSGVGRARL